jgi:hypothetical protein
MYETAAAYLEDVIEVRVVILRGVGGGSISYFYNIIQFKRVTEKRKTVFIVLETYCITTAAEACAT